MSTTSKSQKKQNKLKKRVNNKLIDLEIYAQKHGYMVGELTELDGDCIFSSLHYFGYGSKASVLRKALSLIMYEYRHYKGFLGIYPDMTLSELYYMFNEEELPDVLDKKNNIVKYDYNVMCKDLSNKGEWDRIHPELLFLTISRILDVEIQIYHDADLSVKSYKAMNKEYQNIIPVGYVYKCHYVPLKIKTSDSVNTPQYEII